MSLLADDFFDTWEDWRIELYSSISAFANDPSVEHHDGVARALRELAGDEVKAVEPGTMSKYVPMIAICNDKRKRDAIAIMGPCYNPDDPNYERYGWVNTWKCSKHTPAKMRSQWVERKWSWSGSGLYINRSEKFVNEHKLYEIPLDVYQALCTQFKVL